MNAIPKKVLVVDDDPVIGLSFSRILSKKGYVVVTAQNGREALDKLQEGNYDVVFTDIKMPVMDGIELAEQVKAHHSWTPVVIVTGFGTQTNETRAKAAGVTTFLQKPVSPEMVEEVARNATIQPLPMPEVNVDQIIETLKAEVLPESREYSNPVKFGLLLASPFIGLAYVFALPIMGLAVLGGMLVKALVRKLRSILTLTLLKNVTLFFAAPFIGLVYILAMPFVGLGALAWMGITHLLGKDTK